MYTYIYIIKTYLYIIHTDYTDKIHQNKIPVTNVPSTTSAKDPELS